MNHKDRLLDAAEAIIENKAAHGGCSWRQVGPCVYCNDHDIRLYQGMLPEYRRPTCMEHDWDEETGLGFYFQCRTCGVMEWPE